MGGSLMTALVVELIVIGLVVALAGLVMGLVVGLIAIVGGAAGRRPLRCGGRSSAAVSIGVGRHSFFGGALTGVERGVRASRAGVGASPCAFAPFTPRAFVRVANGLGRAATAGSGSRRRDAAWSWHSAVAASVIGLSAPASTARK